MEFRFFEPWYGFLPREGGHVVACSGAGGKTAVLEACAAALTAGNVPCTVVPWPQEAPDDPDRVVLVEVDRAEGFPVNLPAAGRPVWPPRTSLVLLVLGVGAVGSRAGDAVAGFAPEAPLLAGLGRDDPLEWDHLARILLEPGGCLDQVPAGVPAVLVLAGLADQPDAIGLFDFVGRAMADPRLPIVVLGDPAADPPVLRAACRAEEREPGGD